MLRLKDHMMAQTGKSSVEWLAYTKSCKSALTTYPEHVHDFTVRKTLSEKCHSWDTEDLNQGDEKPFKVWSYIWE